MKQTTISALNALKSGIDTRVTNKIEISSISPVDVGASITDTINTITSNENAFLEDRVIIPSSFALTIDNFGNVLITTP